MFKIANAYDEGRKTMDGAWEIMELHFWDENAGLYKVVSKIQFWYLVLSGWYTMV